MPIIVPLQFEKMFGDISYLFKRVFFTYIYISDNLNNFSLLFSAIDLLEYWTKIFEIEKDSKK